MLLRLLVTLCGVMASVLLVHSQVPSFPGAEGHGRYTTGGRGGKIVHVTNLNDSGAGSFRAAVSGSEKKIVVFDVGGVIALNSNVNIGANTTILGQTAPVPGITLRYYTVNPAGNNIVMRFFRIRRGEEKDVNDGADASTARHYTGLMLDHLSLSWSIDEVASFYDNNNFTLQWCTIGESLNNAGHNKGAHGYGGIWGGKLASFHHNLVCHVNNRSPRFCGARYDWTGYTSNRDYATYKWENAVQAENVDFRNCVVYNCGNGCYGGPGGGKVNMVGNYYKSGPAGSTTRFTTVTVCAPGNAEGYPKYFGMTSRYYLEGNMIAGNSSASSNNWSAITYDAANNGATDASKRNDGVFTIDGERWSLDTLHYNGAGETYRKNSAGKDCIRIRLDKPTTTGSVTTHAADKAYEKVLAWAGASLNRDNVDERYASETRNATATYKGSVTGKGGRIDRVSDVNGYTEANFGTSSRPDGFDTDGDGMPDAWETANGLNPNANDANLYTLDSRKFYTNIEVYANSLVQDIMLSGNADATQSVDEYYPAYTREDGTRVEAINGTTPDNPTVETQAEGAITWVLADGTIDTQAELSSSLTGLIASTAIEMGSHLTVGGTKSSDIMMTTFTINDENSDTAPGDANAVRFVIVPNNGTLFSPTRIAFDVTRFGTGHGRFSAEWLASDGTATVVSAEQLANRDNGEGGTARHTTVDETLSDIHASDGRCELVVHLFDIPYNTNTKYMGLANVVIEGACSSFNTGISDSAMLPTSLATRFTLTGVALPAGRRGLTIMRNDAGRYVKTIVN